MSREPVKLTKVLEEAFEQAKQEAGDPSPAELDRIYRQVHRSPVECVTEVGTDDPDED
jgi:hypothetical protein